MKKTIIGVWLLVGMVSFASCVDNYDAPDLTEPPYGNNIISEANTTIQDLKKQYASVITESGEPVTIDKDIIIEGTVIGDDRSGNLYKQLVIADKTGSIILSINTPGMYAYMPVGQKIRLWLKDLAVGGYGSQPQIGVPYTSEKYGVQIGRMPETLFKSHVRIIGKPDVKALELVPMEVDADWLTQHAASGSAVSTDDQPLLVRIKGSFQEGGKTIYADTLGTGSSTVSHKFILDGGTRYVTVRNSGYASFAKDTLPAGRVMMTGILTNYTFQSGKLADKWQFTLLSEKDVYPWATDKK